MKKVFCFIFVLTCGYCAATDFKITKFKMETDYFKQENQSLITKIDVEYKVHLYEPPHKKWVAYLGGKLSPDLDHFGNEIKMNAFTTFGLDF